MTAGHDLRRADEPIPELEDFMRVIACAAALVRTAAADSPVRWQEGVREVDWDAFNRLAAALARVGIGDNDGVTGGEEGNHG